MDIIPIFFTFNNYYAVPAEVAFHSLLKHASRAYSYRLYVLHTDVTDSAMRNIEKVVGRFPHASVEFIDTSAFDSEEIRQAKGHFSKEIYYKLIAAEIFPQYDRIICSDVDVVFMDDISPSFFMFPDENFYFAGVGQVLESNRMKNYQGKFNAAETEVLKKEIAAGYLLMNLKAIRENDMQRRLTNFYRKNYPRLCLPEQDTIILCCWPDIRYLPLEYVVCNSYYKMYAQGAAFYKDNDGFPKDKEQARKVFTHALEHPVQLHYVGEKKPWNSWGVMKQRIWFEYLNESGFVSHFMQMLPIFALRRLRKYSLKRFLKKQMKNFALNGK